MVSDTWYAEIESTVVTVLQYFLVEADNAPYPELNCTSSSQNESIENINDFPALYVHLLPAMEMGNTLENEDVAAIRATFELQVYSDEGEKECLEIMTECIKEMKKLKFNINMLPDPQTAGTKYFAIARFTRVIANGDSDIVPRE